MNRRTTWRRWSAVGVLGLLWGCGVEAPVESPPVSATVEQAVSTCVGPTGSVCKLVTPAEVGTTGSGDYLDPHVVVRPAAPSRTELVVFLPGTSAVPPMFLGTPPYSDANTSLYASAVSKGYRVIGLDYRNEPAVATLCGGSDACYLATRRTLITGDVQPGSAVTTMSKDDAILPRLTKLLQFLRDSADPTGGWENYFLIPRCTRDCRINPAKLIISGSSQGGGHAAVIGKDYPVRRVAMLASPCDMLEGTVDIASWTLPPLATAPGADRYRGLIARGSGASGYVFDSCEPVAIAHWGADRLDAQWTRVISATGLCAVSPHICVARDAQLYEEWLDLWP